MDYVDIVFLSLYIRNIHNKNDSQDPKTLDAVKFINMLAREGLLSKESFVDAINVTLQRAGNGDLSTYMWMLGESERVPADNKNTQYEALPPFSTYKDYRLGTG